jgi:hypothetical protein
VTAANDTRTGRATLWDRAPLGASLAAIIWLSAVMIVFSDTGVAWPTWMTFFLAGVSLTAWWLLRFAIAAFGDWSRKTHLLRDESRRWIVVPLCIALGVGLSVSSVLLMAACISAPMRALPAHRHLPSFVRTPHLLCGECNV